MDKIEEVRIHLKTILKNGDIYDVIAQKENVKPRSHFLITTNILLFSRIAFLGVLALERIKSYFSPVEKVKEAQEHIRDILGFDVDIIRQRKTVNTSEFKFRERKTLSILYEEPHLKSEEYVERLKRILNFCELHNIDSILLNYDHIHCLFADMDDEEMEDYHYHARGYILGGYYKEQTEDLIYIFTRAELLVLIQKLDTKKIDKKIVAKLGEEIEDFTINNAISEFVQNGNLERLKEIVYKRFILNVNSDNSYKNRTDGKLFETVQIKDGYVQVLVTNQQGIQISSIVQTLYEYLEVSDYAELLKKAKMEADNKETLLIAALYLYLYQEQNIQLPSFRKSSSFYDKIYKQYQIKRKNKKQKIQGLYNKSFKWIKNIVSSGFAIYLTLMLLLVPLITGAALDFVQEIIFQNPDSGIAASMTEYIFIPYLRSFELEKQIIDDVTTDLQNLKLDTLSLSGVTGDSFGNEDKKIIAAIKQISDDAMMPVYFASSYAESGTYQFGQVNYHMVEPEITSAQFYNVEPVFELTYHITKKDV